MSNRLLVNPGTSQAWEMPLKLGINRIGRGNQNHFVINHASISASHCELIVTDSGVTIKDLGSANGTFVERVQVTEFQLQSGHHVQLGSVDMVFESTGLPPLPDAVNLPGDGARIVVANPTPARPAPPMSPIHTPKGNTVMVSKPAVQAAPETQEPVSKNSFIMGVIGAVCGGTAGVLVWYFLIKYTGSSLGLFIWGVGIATGLGARLLSRQGGTKSGIVCGVCALAAMVCGKILFKEQVKSEFYLLLFAIIGIVTAYKIGSGSKQSGT